MSAETQLIQFVCSEWAGPLFFTDTPSWLQDMRDLGRIKPHFGGEDYWYLKVQTADGEVTIGPGEWIRHDNGVLLAGEQVQP